MSNNLLSEIVLKKEFEDKLLNKLLCRTNSYYNIPSAEQYFKLFKLVDIIYDTLFFHKLPGVMITVNPEAGQCGKIELNKWQKDNFKCHEINIEPPVCEDKNKDEKIDKNKKQDFIIYLVHILCHFQQKLNNTNPSTPYHNTDFYNRMNQMGLLTHGIGKDNDKSTGQYVSFKIKEGGMFEKLLLEIKDDDFLPWQSIAKSNNNKDKNSRKNKVAYQCSKCKIKVWGKPDLNIICGKCNKPFKEIINNQSHEKSN